MEIGYTEEQQALRNELREYYAKLLTPEVEEQLATRATASAPTCAGSSSRWPPTAGSGIGWPTE